MTSFQSEDGRWSIMCYGDESTYVKLIEYAGTAPRRIVQEMDLPIEQFKVLMQTANF